MVTVYSPDKTRIRSRHALLQYCSAHKIDIEKFGDLKFFYNPNYLQLQTSSAMKKILQLLNEKRQKMSAPSKEIQDFTEKDVVDETDEIHHTENVEERNDFSNTETNEIPKVFNGIPVKDQISFACGGYNRPSLDENGQMFWPKSVIRHVGLQNLAKDKFQVYVGPFGEKRIISQDKLDKQHQDVVEKGWLLSMSRQMTPAMKKNLIFTNSSEYLKVKMCPNHMKNDSYPSNLHPLGQSCQENRIYLSKKTTSCNATKATSTKLVSTHTVKLCHKALGSVQLKPQPKLIDAFRGPTFGLDTIYGDIESRLTGQSDRMPFVFLNKYKISPEFIENSGFESFRHEI